MPSRREFISALSVGAGVLYGAQSQSSESSAGRRCPDPYCVEVRLEDSVLRGRVSSKTSNGVLRRKSRWTGKTGSGRRASIVERWTRTAAGHRCEIEIRGEKTPWSAPVRVSIAYPARATTRIWTCWDHYPEGPRSEWTDPLIPAPLQAIRYTYGGPRYTLEHPGIPWYSWGQQHHGERYFSVPVFTWIEPGTSGCSVILSPEPVQLDLEMSVAETGRLDFTWYRYKLSSAAPVRLAFDVVHHGDDFREGLGWMMNRYREYFYPPNPRVQNMAGAGAYSTYDGELDAPEMHRMAFSINWRASFDFPYMGMFLPPVAPDAEWTSFRRTPTSAAGLEAYCRRMKDGGFHVLSYFNVTEFGTNIHYPPAPGDQVKPDEADWRNPNQYLFSRFESALLRVPPNLPLAGIHWPGGWERTRPGGLFYTWEKGIGVDPGEPVYADFLMEQARRHLDRLPSSSGFCIDRLDWLRFYNTERDDGVSWFDDKPARSIYWSWLQLMNRLGPLVHNAGKVIFVNPICKRLDAFRHVDGFFDEMADDPAALNGVAFAGICKPVIVWRDAPIPPAQVDSYFQRLLYLGVFPMCPYPKNDHGLDWGSPETRRPFTDYGPLLAAIRGREWVLKAHAWEIEDAQHKTSPAKANLFSVPQGYAVPIVFGEDGEVVLKITGAVPNTPGLMCDVLHPGVEDAQPLGAEWTGDVLVLRVPLRRGCGVVRITTADHRG